METPEYYQSIRHHFAPDDDTLHLKKMPPNCVEFNDKSDQTIRMRNEDGKEAVIDFGGDSVQYGGNLPIDESAKIFFEAVYGFFQGSM